MTVLIEFTPEVDVAPIVEPLACDELGRATRCYVSGYDRSRVHEARLVRGEKRCLVADFNGAISASRSIVGATWRCQNYSGVIMSNGRIIESGRAAAVDIEASVWTGSAIKLIAEMDNGERYTQIFVVNVRAAPWFNEDVAAGVGPSEIVVAA